MNENEELIKWINVNDQLPNEDDRILTCDKNYHDHIEICRYEIWNNWGVTKLEFVNEQDEQPSVVFPTHWAQLPKGPGL